MYLETVRETVEFIIKVDKDYLERLDWVASLHIDAFQAYPDARPYAEAMWRSYAVRHYIRVSSRYEEPIRVMLVAVMMRHAEKQFRWRESAVELCRHLIVTRSPWQSEYKLAKHFLELLRE